MFLGWAISISLICLTLMQVVFVVLYCRSLRCGPPEADGETFEPHDAPASVASRVAVILCVRGADPSLTACLNGLARLAHPNYDLHLAADSEADAGLRAAQTLLNQISSPNYRTLKTHVIKSIESGCSLKCTALITTIMSLDQETEIVALVDADSIVDACWLSDLIAPLTDERVGVATGNRWFEPLDQKLGSRVRQVWNAAAIAQMSVYQIPWGGSLAIRTETIESCDLLNVWSKCFCEDTPLPRIMKSNQLQVVRVHDLIVPNTESTTLSEAFRWITRQLITVRLHHRAWPLVLGHAIFSLFCLAGAIVGLGVIGGWAGQESRAVFWTLLGSFAFFQTVNCLLLRTIGNANRKIIASRQRANGEAIRQQGNPTIAEMEVEPGTASKSLVATLAAVLATQAIYPFAALNAARKRTVRWRGIDYELGNRGRVTMLEYQPFAQASESSQSDGSL